MNKFSSINGFDQLYKKVRRHASRSMTPLPTAMPFTGSVKLHGCNMGVSKEAAGYIGQSRNRQVTLDDDHNGIAAFIDRTPVEVWDKLFSHFDQSSGIVTIFGEWVGKGVQSGVAISELDKHFVIFGASVESSDVKDEDGFPICTYFDVPEYVSAHDHGIRHIAEAGLFHVKLDMTDPESCNKILTDITLYVEQQCPYASMFNVEGIGEGVVWKWDIDPCDSDLWFKTKGDKHSNRGNKTAAPVDPAILSSIDACVAHLITEPRLNQGIEYLREMGHPLDKSSTGHYLRWVANDCCKEDMDVITANDMEWKDVAKSVNSKARDFFVNAIFAVD